MIEFQTTLHKRIVICPKCGNQYGAAFKCYHLGHPEIQAQEKKKEGQCLVCGGFHNGLMCPNLRVTS